MTMQCYKTKVCRFFLENRCLRGTNCTFAHSTEELRAQPDLRKTKICGMWAKGKCHDPTCQFAHGAEELRSPAACYKTSLCFLWQKGQCTAGDRCRYAHGVEELRTLKLMQAEGKHPCDDPLMTDTPSEVASTQPSPTRGNHHHHHPLHHPPPDEQRRRHHSVHFAGPLFHLKAGDKLPMARHHGGRGRFYSHDHHSITHCDLTPTHAASRTPQARSGGGGRRHTIIHPLHNIGHTQQQQHQQQSPAPQPISDVVVEGGQQQQQQQRGAEVVITASAIDPSVADNWGTTSPPHSDKSVTWAGASDGESSEDTPTQSEGQSVWGHSSNGSYGMASPKQEGIMQPPTHAAAVNKQQQQPPVEAANAHMAATSMRLEMGPIVDDPSIISINNNGRVCHLASPTHHVSPSSNAIMPAGIQAMGCGQPQVPQGAAGGPSMVRQQGGLPPLLPNDVFHTQPCFLPGQIGGGMMPPPLQMSPMGASCNTGGLTPSTHAPSPMTPTSGADPTCSQIHFITAIQAINMCQTNEMRSLSSTLQCCEQYEE
ncbi:unnamed protein product [Vitrella brassicaformis CCMP3155]|uniref:C3H1-type domain-containing protein n=1 Tax=Vitrella brassicaformis (strain CCMP3155) TaxID=1169540 RepID=A0A0G4EV76_VITBC|nr:unnamed protein product [Vitrella brassicaformis CCMP3155]|mmetsp:Transcript_36050/g.89911  ORF Transcript_36050/g.89911 Transcript_36050/m.89911 type:complete len:540 (-) Transcript_36050:55-1674(-)|eukprot:CEM01964.1 unnamed protein product [Vitrella brassicaformis CCMP3155]